MYPSSYTELPVQQGALSHEHYTKRFFCFGEQTVWSVFLSKKECCTILLLGHRAGHGAILPKYGNSRAYPILRPNGLKIVYLPGVLLSILSEVCQSYCENYFFSMLTICRRRRILLNPHILARLISRSTCPVYHYMRFL